MAKSVVSEGRIRPDYSFRFTIDDIKSCYGSAENAFAAGDFMLAAQLAEGDSELKACALILAGLLEEGLSLFADCNAVSVRGRLCRAYALWSLDRNAEAKESLKDRGDSFPTPDTANFGQLLDRDNITVFLTAAVPAIFPELQSANAQAAIFKFGPITVKYVGSQRDENAYEYEPAQPFDEFIAALPPNEQPDLIFALTPQWVVPANFHKVQVPKAIWCHDTDLFIYRNAENFALYDIGICACSQEHFEFGRSTGVFSVTNVMFHPLNTTFQEARIPERKKDIDILFTGSSLATFHAEKPRFIFQLAQLSEHCRIRVIDGHIPQAEYFDLLSRSKFLPVIGRHAGAPSPRWREALTSSCCVLYPAGTFYDEIAPGCFPFHSDTIAADIRHHVDRYNSGLPGYRLDAIVPEVNRRFAIHRQTYEKSFERLLKYAVFMALIWKPNKRAEIKNRRRLVWLAPGVDCTFFNRARIRDQISKYGAGICEDDLHDAIGFNNAAHLFAQMAFIFRDDRANSEWATKADGYFAEGIKRFPRSLLLRFNEAYWHFFKPNGNEDEAVEKFRGLINDFDGLEFERRGADVGFLGSVLSDDPIFPYYEYTDLVTRELVIERTRGLLASKGIRHSSRDLLRAACLGFLGWSAIRRKRVSDGMKQVVRALEIVPENLPLTKLYFEILLEQYSLQERFSRQDAATLADAFVAAANLYPTILLTHIDPVVHILAMGNRRDIARELALAWYRLENVVFQKNPELSPLHNTRKLSTLYHHRDVLPKTLMSRIESCRAGTTNLEDLSQLEQAMVATAEAYDRKPALQKVNLRGRVADVSVSFGNRQERVSMKLIIQALLVWFKLPGSLKWLYVSKTVRMSLDRELGKAILRIQKWGTESIWAKRWNF